MAGTQFLSEQVLLTTLVVKLALIAALATMLVRYRRFRHILIFERRRWPDRLAFALGLRIPLAAGGLAGVVAAGANCPRGAGTGAWRPLERPPPPVHVDADVDSEHGARAARDRALRGDSHQDLEQRPDRAPAAGTGQAAAGS